MSKGASIGHNGGPPLDDGEATPAPLTRRKFVSRLVFGLGIAPAIIRTDRAWSQSRLSRGLVEPPAGVILDRYHPLTVGLLGYFLPRGTNPITDLCGNFPALAPQAPSGILPIASGGVTNTMNPLGPGVDQAGGGALGVYTNYQGAMVSGVSAILGSCLELTLMVMLTPQSFQYLGGGFWLTASGSGILHAGVNRFAGSQKAHSPLEWRLSNTTPGTNFGASSANNALTLGIPAVLVSTSAISPNTHAGSQQHTLYVTGALPVAATGFPVAPQTWSEPLDTLSIGMRGSYAFTFTGVEDGTTGKITSTSQCSGWDGPGDGSGLGEYITGNGIPANSSIASTPNCPSGANSGSITINNNTTATGTQTLTSYSGNVYGAYDIIHAASIHDVLKEPNTAQNYTNDPTCVLFDPNATPGSLWAFANQDHEWLAERDRTRARSGYRRSLWG